MAQFPALHSQTFNLPQVALAGAQMGQIKQQNQLAQAKQQYGAAAMGGDQDAMKKLATVDPEYAQKLMETSKQIAQQPYEQWQATYEPVTQTLNGLLMADPMQAAAAWPRVREQATQMGIPPDNLPQQWDPDWAQQKLIELGAMDEYIKETQGSVPQGYRRQPGGGLQIDPGYFQGEAALKAAGRNVTNINMGPQGIDYGDPPTNMTWARDEQGNIILQEDPETGHRAPVAVPIQGGPMARDIQAGKEEAEAKQERQEAYGDVVTQDIDRVFEITESSDLPVTGMGSYIASIPGTPARDVSALVDTIRANIGFDRLQQMRDASPTGGALGQVSEMENRLLQATLGNLEQSQTEGQFLRNLKRVKKMYLDIIHGEGNYPDSMLAVPGGDEGGEDIPSRATATATGPEGKKAYLVDGQWVDENGNPVEGQ